MQRVLMIGTTLACLGLASAAFAQPTGGTGNHNSYGTHPLMAASPPPPPMMAEMASAPTPCLESQIAAARNGIASAQAAHKLAPRHAHHDLRALKRVERKLDRLSAEVSKISQSMPQ